MRRILSLAENIPFASAILLAAKIVFDSRLRGPKFVVSDGELEKWCSIVRRDGVCAVENFLTEDMCARLRAEVDALMVKYPSAVHVDEKNSDHRLFMGDLPPGEIAGIYCDERLAVCASAFLGRGAINLATMSGRLAATLGNVGSGGGWHRDSFTNQFKTIIYLNNVEKENGPFQYLCESHKLKFMIQDKRCAGLRLAQNRVTDDQVQKLIGKSPKRLKTFTGKAGTLILADTTGLHRGAPIATGVRYSLTNYYFAPRTLTAVCKNHFKPILGIHTRYNRTANISMESM